MESIDRLNQAISYLTTGLSLSEYIKHRRLACAADDLININQHITDIAVKYGYESPNTFSVAFKRHYHISPVDVKKASLSLPPFPRMYDKLTVEQVIDGTRLKKCRN